VPAPALTGGRGSHWGNQRRRGLEEVREGNEGRWGGINFIWAEIGEGEHLRGKREGTSASARIRTSYSDIRDFKPLFEVSTSTHRFKDDLGGKKKWRKWSHIGKEISLETHTLSCNIHLLNGRAKSFAQEPAHRDFSREGEKEEKKGNRNPGSGEFTV